MKNKGFTLIELLVVVAIIGLLSSVVLISLNTARSKARDAKRLADVKAVATALEIFFNDAGSYPVVATAGVVGTVLNYGGTGAYTSPAVAFNGASGYIRNVPTAPTPADGTCSTAGAASSDANPYKYSGSASTYTITFCLGAVTGGYSGGLRTLTPNGIQ